jgi:CRP-like cAMP-binding protein
VLRGGRGCYYSQAKKVLGEMALIKGTLRSATVRAQDACEVLQFPRPNCRSSSARHSQIMHADLADMPNESN